MAQQGGCRQGLRLLGRLWRNLGEAPAQAFTQQLGAGSAMPAAAPQSVFVRGLKRALRRKAVTRDDSDMRRAVTVDYPMPVHYYRDRRVEVRNLDNEVVSSATLPGKVFNVPVRLDIMHRVIRWQLAKRRQGTHKVKTRSEVSGGGKKPRPQKKQGRSRQGSIRAPHFRGGGVVFGPVPRSHAIELPKKVRRLGLRSALSAKLNEGRLIIVESLKPEHPKTRAMAAHLAALLSQQQRLSACLVDSDKAGADGGSWLRRAAGNIPHVEVVPQGGANVYSILNKDVLVMTRQAAAALCERLLTPINRCGVGRGRGGAACTAARGRPLRAGGVGSQRGGAGWLHAPAVLWGAR
jgi:large subunit ribosomal protein L4